MRQFVSINPDMTSAQAQLAKKGQQTRRKRIAMHLTENPSTAVSALQNNPSTKASRMPTDDPVSTVNCPVNCVARSVPGDCLS